MSQVPDDWQRLQTIFRKAVDVSPEDRGEFVDNACGTDVKLRAEIESLLDSYEPAEEELEESPVFAFEPPKEPSSEELRASREDAISGYKILEELHRGGQGIVYRAIQQSTKREVALKFMLTGPLVGDDTKRRFEREVDLVGRLRHPGIVRVYDSGLASGQYYYVMDLIHGARLDNYVRDNVLSLPQLISLYIKVCDAVNHAHQRGVIHRDLKPSNILVDPEGQPHVLDFGLAKLRDRSLEDTISVTGQVMGTLAYMSPEQAAGKTDQMDTRSDVYSLGVVLYELLTGQLPYNVEDSFHKGLSAIKDHQPNRLHLRQSRIGNEVSTIVFKALNKEMDRRYQIAGALGDDLQRYLRGEPIEAKRDSAFYVLRKTIHRHWAAAIATAAFLLLLMGSSILSTALFWEADKARDRADQSASAFENQRDQMELLRNESVEQLYVAEMNLAGEALGQPGGVSRIEEITSHWLKDESLKQLRGWEWYYLRSQCNRESFIWENDDEVWCVQWHPTEDRVAFGDYNGNVWLWDLHQPPTKLGHVGKLVRSVAWGKNGETLAAGSTLGGMKVWNVKDRTMVFELPDLQDVLDMAWRPEKPEQLAISTGSGALQVWDTQADKQTASFSFSFGIQTVDWKPKGGTLLAACHDGKFRILNVDNEKVVKTGGPGRAALFSAFWQPEGKQIAFSNTDGVIELTDRSNSRGAWTTSVNRPIWRIDFDKQGKRLASVGSDRTLRIWGLQDQAFGGHLIQRFEGHRGEVWGLDWNHDSSMIATSGRDKTVRIWKPTDRMGDRWLLVPDSRANPHLRALTWSPRQNRIAFGSADSRMYIWNLDTDQLDKFKIHDGKNYTLQWSHDGTRLISSATDETAVIWDAEKQKITTTFTRHQGIKVNGPENAIHATKWSSDDQLVASIAHNGSLYIWDPESGEVTAEQHGSWIPYDLVWHPHEKTLIYVGGESTEVKLWRVGSGEPPAVLHQCPVPIHSLAWSPDTKQIAAGRQDGWIDLIDPESVRPALTLKDHVSPVRDMEFSPDSERLATASDDGTVRIWDPRRGTQTLVIPTGLKGVDSVSWSPEGKRLAYLGSSRIIRVLNPGRAFAREAAMEESAAARSHVPSQAATVKSSSL